ncbi:zinc-binding dehydrogenase [Pseudooceanicola sp. 216_PA32_1]|uniref:Zinc-binding dehydrogenase n=1 Tax=Pseudooceanicola pacificus TaxID=2676438 RepID=A0A844WF46_9RHOB|nr:NAD(P)-dependent alcohol dehydrogenase [Pseudooceanicola pacificus]MWB77949.1 zinc-binding dehydrogenase [Pseudooceanicola pacificus]
MRSYHIDRSVSPIPLVLKDHDAPTPGDRDVLIRVRASSLNYRDLLILKGTYGRNGPGAGRVPVSDGAGEVIAVGPRVTRFKIGDRVAGTFMPKWIAGPISAEAVSVQPNLTEDGWLTELRLADESACVRIPDQLSFEEAATLPCAAVTAWSALTAFRPVLPGETVLTQGSGGVSIFALQFAKTMGARVIATTSSAEKAARLSAMGADVTVNYREDPDWHLAVRAATHGHGVDHIIEVGGVGTLERSIKSAALGAQINLIGVLSEAEGFDPGVISSAIVTINRATVGSRQQFEAMNRAIAAQDLHPVIDRVFDFAQAPEAFSYFEGRGHFGKVVIRHPAA